MKEEITIKQALIRKINPKTYGISIPISKIRSNELKEGERYDFTIPATKKSK